MSKVTDLANKETQEILSKYNLKFHYKLTFPVYNVLPDEVKLALNILEKHGMNIIIEFREKESK